MTVPQAAARLGVSVTTTYGLLASGRLGHFRIGLGRGVYRISEEHIAAYLQSAERAERKPAAPAPAVPRLKHIHLT